MCHKLFSTILLLLFYVGSVSGADLFQLTITEGGVTKTMSYSSVDELPDYNTMQQQFTSVSNWNADALSIELNYRGIDLTANFSANDDEVVFIIPSLNKTWSYEGTSRQGSWTQLTDALVQESDLVNDLLGLMVLYTPNDPVAGNPSSLMDNFVRLDFSPVLVDLPLGPSMGGGMGDVVEPEQTPNADDGMGEESSSVSAGSLEVTESDEEFGEESSSVGERENIIGIGLGFSSYDQGGSKVNTTTISTALHDVDEAVLERIMSNLSKRARETLQEELEFRSHQSGSEVQAARDQVSEAIAEAELEAD